MSTVLVRPLLRILANGRRRDGTKSWLKFTVIATPEPVNLVAGASDAFDLAEWPKHMATLLRTKQAPFSGAGIAAAIRPITATALPAFDDVSWNTVPLSLPNPAAFLDGRAWDRIGELWKRTLAIGGDDAWSILSNDLKQSLDGGKRTITLKDRYEGNVDQGLAEDGAILHKADTAKPVAINGVLPIRQTDLAIEQESERAARVLAKQLRGPHAVPAGDRFIAEALPPKDRFKPVTKATDPERLRSYTANKEAEDVLKGKPPKPNTPLAAASPVPASGAVLTKGSSAQEEAAAGSAAERNQRRATHQYGTWLQRQEGKGKVGSTADHTTVDEQRSEQIRGAYFALQGDPVLSRLFCMAIDFEIEERLVASTGEAVKLHLGLPSAGGGRRVITAALLGPQAFWPVSAFEAKVYKTENGEFGMLSREDLADQQNGIWRLGATIAAETTVNESKKSLTVARYDLPSIDMRRAVDSKTAGHDFGEPHHTGGLSILDRGRADQIARDLALSTSQAADADAIVLHAEELTVGRRVDVAAVLDHKNTLAELDWRSLMRRYVDFDFDNLDTTVEAVLTGLMSRHHPQKGILEEVSFQVAARYMPTAASAVATTPVEAVAEEALFVWDGTPAGVLTDSGSGNRAADSGVPFDRVLDLPSFADGHPELIPPPLRFGVAYAVRVRSMFMGGGSPDATHPDTKASTSAEQLLPAAVGQTVKPRRFLRHEPISAPIALLPVHLVERRYAEMGYEQVDQAIVRTHNVATTETLSDDEPNVFKGAYVAASTRAQPDQTLRVFIPPQVAVGLVARHRKLDVKDRGRVLKGGLTDVSFTPARVDGPSHVLTPSGFPVAVTYRRDTLDKDGAIYRRRMSAAKTSDDRGVPVFEPGGKNETKDGEIGYLPDPAATHYSIRARRRGSDQYLTGDIQVGVYDGTSYPDVLPLAIKVRRPGFGFNALRSDHPDKIATLAPTSRVAWMNASGDVLPTKSNGTVRVQCVEFILHPGEDYDLEVACLPDPAELRKDFSLPETMAIQLLAAATDPEAAKVIKAICGTADFAKICTVKDTQDLTGLAGAAVPVTTTLDVVATHLVDTMRNQWPIEEVAGVTKLRVAHAVDRPMLSAEWIGKPRAYRQDAETANEKLEDVEGAQDVIIDGQVAVDLDLVESIQIVAVTTATDGSALDPPERGRSSLSKRAGRWPKHLTPDGTEALVPIVNVLGFEVNAQGEVTLPESSVTLLSVGNLPVAGAVGAVSSPKPVFGATEARRTAINLAPLFAAAGAGGVLNQDIARPDDAAPRMDEVNDVEKPGQIKYVEEFRHIKLERPHLFKDTLARKLRLSIVAVSRHAPAFETEPAYFEGREQALYRRQPLKRADQTVVSTLALEAWMQSSKRPSQPDVRRPEPSFSFERRYSKGKYTLVRTARTRLYLGRNWFSSGEGERLGIILWPPNYRALDEFDVDKDDIALDGRTLQLHDFDDSDLGEIGPFITRWGGDPIRRDPSPQTGHFIPPVAFGEIKRMIDRQKKKAQQNWPHDVHDVVLVDEVRVPIRRPGSASTATESFDYFRSSLLTFKPCFDIDREEWYVDVDLNPTRASEPFVRFGLIRYQEHAIEGLQASEPVTVFSQLLPERTVEVSLDAVPTGEKVTVKVAGLASLGIKPIAVPPTPGHKNSKTDPHNIAFASLAMPKVRISVFHERDLGENGMARTPLTIDSDGQLDVLGPQLPGGDDTSWLVEPTRQNATLVWESAFRIAQGLRSRLGPGIIVAYVEEVDLRMPASYRNEPITVDTMFDAGTFVYSGPRFSGRVPFLDIA